MGLCGSDRHWFLDGRIGETGLPAPLVLGHEIVGVVETGPRTGERVVVDPADPCGRCAECAAGAAHLCARMRFAGHAPYDGGLRERMAWPDRLLRPVPPAVDDADATLLEPLGVALHALDLGSVAVGMRVAVHGAGPIGILVVRALRAAGIRSIFATEPLGHRAEAATASGALTVLPGEVPDVDVSFETAGDDAALDAAIRTTRAGGRIVLVGIPAEDRTSFSASAARRRELSLVHARRMRAADLERAIALVASGEVRVDGLVSDRHPLARATDAFEALVERRGLKVVVEPAPSAS